MVLETRSIFEYFMPDLIFIRTFTTVLPRDHSFPFLPNFHNKLLNKRRSLKTSQILSILAILIDTKSTNLTVTILNFLSSSCSTHRFIAILGLQSDIRFRLWSYFFDFDLEHILVISITTILCMYLLHYLFLISVCWIYRLFSLVSLYRILLWYFDSCHTTLFL